MEEEEGVNTKRGNSSNNNPLVTVMPILTSYIAAWPPYSTPSSSHSNAIFSYLLSDTSFPCRREKYVDGKRKRGVNKKIESSRSSKKKPNKTYLMLCQLLPL